MSRRAALPGSTVPDGVGGNWGLEASRFPTAWNVLDKVRLAQRPRRHRCLRRRLRPDASDLDMTRRQPVGATAPGARATEAATDRTTARTSRASSARRTTTPARARARRSASRRQPGRAPVRRPLPRPFASSQPPIIDSVVPHRHDHVGELGPVAADARRQEAGRAVAESARHQHEFDHDGARLRDDEAALGSSSAKPATAARASATTRRATGPCTPNTLRHVPRQDVADDGDFARQIAERRRARRTCSSRSRPATTATRSARTRRRSPRRWARPERVPPGSLHPRRRPQDHAFGWADARLDRRADANPIIMVEAIDINNRRARSRTSAATSRPRPSTSSAPCPATRTGRSSGTSMAAPFVAGLAGFLRLLRSAALGRCGEERDHRGRAADTTDGVQPRIDAYASLLRVPGALHDLADWNDPSLDGNRRDHPRPRQQRDYPTPRSGTRRPRSTLHSESRRQRRHARLPPLPRRAARGVPASGPASARARPRRRSHSTARPTHPEEGSQLRRLRARDRAAATAKKRGRGSTSTATACSNPTRASPVTRRRDDVVEDRPPDVRGPVRRRRARRRGLDKSDLDQLRALGRPRGPRRHDVRGRARHR